MITVHLNGKALQLDGEQTIRALVTAHGDDRPGVAIAVNGHVVPRGQWERTPLSEGDDVLMVRPAAGG